MSGVAGTCALLVSIELQVKALFLLGASLEDIARMLLEPSATPR